VTKLHADQLVLLDLSLDNGSSDINAPRSVEPLSRLARQPYGSPCWGSALPVAAYIGRGREGEHQCCDGGGELHSGFGWIGL
jgi:hypothetical protein